MAQSPAERLREQLSKQPKAPAPPKSTGKAPAGGTAADRLRAQMAAGGPAAAVAPKKKVPGLLRQVTDIAGMIPRAVVQVGADAGREALNTGKQAANALPGVEVRSVQPRKGESFADFYRRTHPLTASVADSAANTARKVGEGAVSLVPGGLKPSETRYAEDVREGRIVGSLLEDVANVTAAGRIVGKGATAAGAPRVAKVANAPSAAGRAALRPVKKAARTAYEATATGDGRIAQTLQTLKLDPNSRVLRREAIEPAAEKVSEGVGAAVKRGEAVAKVLPDLDEQRAMTLVGEGEAPALARLRAHLPADQFDDYVTKKFGEAVPRRAVDLAADVVDGKAPELGARIDEALTLGREMPGGRADRAAAYVAAKPSREPQLGFEPLPQVVESRLAPLEASRKRVDLLAGGARAKADRAAAELAQVEGASRPTPKRATAGLEQAAMRVQAARAKVAEARQAAAGAEDALMATATIKAEKAARSGLRREVLDYRRQAQAHARQVAKEMEEGLIPDRPAPVPRASAMHDVAEAFREGLGAQYANRRFFSADRGVDLDVWLGMWNDRRRVVPEITSGDDYARVADDAIAYFRTIRELRGAANGVVSRGAEGRALVHLMEDPDAERFLRGAPDEAVAALVDERGPLASDAGPDALAAAYGRIDAGGKLRPIERRIAAAERAAPTLARAEERLGAARETTTTRLLDAGARSALPLGRAQMRARITENVARSAERRQATMAGHLEAAKRDAAHSLDAAPARLRPVLKANREAASLLTQQENRLRAQGLGEAAKAAGRAADELATTLERLRASGVDFDHFTHLKLDAKPTTAGAQAGALPKTRKGREERRRKGSTTYDRTVRAQVQAEIDQVKIGVAREAVEKIRTLPFARRFSSIEAATKEGYVAWDAANPFEKAGQITSTTVFVPAKLHEHFRSYFNDPSWDKLLKRTYDPAITAFKITVLPLSPSWQVGNVLGNTLLATVAGGVGPAEMVKQVARTVKMYRASGPPGQRSFEAIAPRRLYTAGPTHEEFRFLRPPEEMVLGDGRVSRAIRTAAKPAAAVVRGSWALNGFVDNLGRSAVFLSRIDKGATPDQALKAGLRAMGDFSRMTAFERRVVRRFVPFYAWQRHLTQLAFRLPVEHPMRTAWTLHLAEMFGRDESLEDLPEFLRGSVPLPGGRLLGTRGLNPFSQVGGPVLSPGDALRNLSPALKIPLEAYTGVDTLDGRPFSRPPGTGRLDEFGRDLPTAPGYVKRITDISPQKRLLESLQGRGRVVRYDTGDPVLTKTGPIETERTPAQGLARFLGFPLTSRTEAERIRAAAAEKEADAAKRREAYERRKKAAASSR
jgi:hypothetical protein